MIKVNLLTGILLLFSVTIYAKSPNAFQMLEAERVEIEIKTFNGAGYIIYWDDDTITEANSAQKISHTYPSPYSGKIRLEELNGMHIEAIVIGGGFAFDIQQLYGFAPRIQALTMNAGIQCYGNIASKPTSLIYLDFQTGDFYGHFNEDRLKRVERLRVVDGNTISFDLADFDQTIKYIGVTGENTATGLIDSLNYPRLHHFDLKGANTVSGDLGKIKATLPTVFYLGGNNTANQYTPGNLHFSSSPKIFILAGPQNVLTTERLDALLIDLDAATTSWVNPALLILTEAHPSPSVDSDNARLSLERKGAKVFTN
ncbi:MAG: hypothetical protein AAGG75_16180 [Bacteroidota bacterium]